VNGIGISWAICKSAPCSRQMTTPAPHHSVFYRPDALTATQSTAPKALRAAIVATLPWEVQKSHFLQYYSYILLIIYVISDERNCNPLAHSTWKCHYTNLWNAKLFVWLKACCIPSTVGGSWVGIDGSEKNWLWCVATGMSGKQRHSKCSK